MWGVREQQQSTANFEGHAGGVRGGAWSLLAPWRDQQAANRSKDMAQHTAHNVNLQPKECTRTTPVSLAQPRNNLMPPHVSTSTLA